MEYKDLTEQTIDGRIRYYRKSLRYPDDTLRISHARVGVGIIDIAGYGAEFTVSWYVYKCSHGSAGSQNWE